MPRILTTNSRWARGARAVPRPRTPPAPVPGRPGRWPRRSPGPAPTGAIRPRPPGCRPGRAAGAQQGRLQRRQPLGQQPADQAGQHVARAAAGQGVVPDRIDPDAPSGAAISDGRTLEHQHARSSAAPVRAPAPDAAPRSRPRSGPARRASSPGVRGQHRLSEAKPARGRCGRRRSGRRRPPPPAVPGRRQQVDHPGVGVRIGAQARSDGQGLLAAAGRQDGRVGTGREGAGVGLGQGPHRRFGQARPAARSPARGHRQGDQARARAQGAQPARCAAPP